jgi:hypothetical protein
MSAIKALVTVRVVRVIKYKCCLSSQEAMIGCHQFIQWDREETSRAGISPPHYSPCL